MDALHGAGYTAVQMLHRSDPKLHHLERRVERVEVGIDVASSEPACEPKLEGMIGRAELKRRQADVMMAVDEAGQDDIFGGSERLVRAVRLRKLGI